MVLFWAWRPEDGTLEAEQRDHVPYRDWARAGFLELCPGDMVDFSMVEETVAAVAEEFQLDTLGVDPYLSRTLTPRLMERHIPVIEVPQDMKNLSPAMKEAGAADPGPPDAPQSTTPVPDGTSETCAAMRISTRTSGPTSSGASDASTLRWRGSSVWPWRW